jgi:hypothetical protein
MSYIPKNKIQTGLYTNEEYVFASNQQKYSGPYYKLYNGKVFSGVNQNDPTTQELIPISSIDKENVLPPTILYNPLLPTSQDYKNGFFTRYFSIRRNQLLFVEIDNNTYKSFQQQDSQVPWKLYRVFSLKWELTGDINKVAQTNKNVTELVERKEKVLGLGLYLKENWIQYYKETA